MENGNIIDSQITASSEINANGQSVTNARLNRPGSVGQFGGPATSDLNQWVQVDLGVSRLVTGMIMQGRDQTNVIHCVKKYKVQYSSVGDTDTWQYVKKSNEEEDVVRL